MAHGPKNAKRASRVAAMANQVQSVNVEQRQKKARERQSSLPNFYKVECYVPPEQMARLRGLLTSIGLAGTPSDKDLVAAFANAGLNMPERDAAHYAKGVLQNANELDH